MKKAQQVIADIERFKLAAIELIDRAIALKTCPYEDVLCFEPYLTSSLDSKWKFHWKAAFDTIKIHYEMKGYIVNLQGKRYPADDFRTLSEHNVPNSYWNVCKVYWVKNDEFPIE